LICRTSSLGSAPGTAAALGFRLSRLRIQVSEDLLNDLGILYTDEDTHRTATAGKISISISMPKTRLRRCAHIIAARRSNDISFSLSPGAAH
jgi:hypothetical protein